MDISNSSEELNTKIFDDSIQLLLQAKEKVLKIKEQKDLMATMEAGKSLKYIRMEKHLEKLAEQTTIFKVKLTELK